MNAEVISKIFFKRTNRWSLRELSTIGPIYCSIPGQVCPVDVVFRVCVLTFFRVRKSKEEVEMEMESSKEVDVEIDVVSSKELDIEIMAEPKIQKTFPAKKQKIEWNDDMIETLINAYQAKPSLWDMTKNEYKDVNKKNLALEYVAQAMEEYGVAQNEWKTKWNNLRTQFLRDISTRRARVPVLAKARCGTQDGNGTEISNF